MGQKEDRNWIEDIKSGVVSLEEAPAEIIDQIANGEVSIEEEGSYQPEEDAEQQTESVEQETQTEVQEDIPQDDSKQSEDEEAWFKRKNYELSNELNTERQRRQAHEQRLKNDPLYREQYLKELGVDLGVSNQKSEEKPSQDLDDVDVYDEGVLKQTLKELNELKAWKLQKEKEDQSRQYEQRMTAEQRKVQEKVSMIENVVSNSQLKTDMPFSKLNQLVESGARTPEQLKGYGVSDSDIQKLSKIYSAANSEEFKRTNDFEYALTKSLGSYQFSDPVRETQEKMLRQKQEEIKSQTETMSAPRGAQGFGEQSRDGMSVDLALQIVQKLENRDLSSLRKDERSDLENAWQVLGIS